MPDRNKREGDMTAWGTCEKVRYEGNTGKCGLCRRNTRKDRENVREGDMTGEHARKYDMMRTRENARYAGETRKMAGRTYEKALCRRKKREGDMT